MRAAVQSQSPAGLTIFNSAQLAERFDLARTSVTRALDRLITDGLVNARAARRDNLAALLAAAGALRARAAIERHVDSFRSNLLT